MKNYLLNFRWIRLFLFVISIWLIGSCSLFGQGWVRKISKPNEKISFNILFNNIYNNSIDIIGNEILNNKIITYKYYRYNKNGYLLKNLELFSTTKFDTFNIRKFAVDSKNNIHIYYSNNLIEKKLEFDSNGIYKNTVTFNNNFFYQTNSINSFISLINDNRDSKFVYQINTNELIIDSLILEKNTKFHSIYIDNNNNKILIGYDSIYKFTNKNLFVWKKNLPNDIKNLDLINFSTNIINDNYLIMKNDSSDKFLYKFNSNGDSILLKKSDLIKYSKIYSNEIFFIQSYDNGSFTNSIDEFKIFDKELNELNFSRTILKNIEKVLDVIIDNNNFIICGYTDVGFPFNTASGILVKLNQFGNLFSNELNIKYFLDDNKNCIKNNNERLLKNKYINIKDKYLQDNYYNSNIDSLLIDLDTGSYVIHPIAPVYYQLCEDSITFAHNKFYDTVRIEIPLKPIVICPYLEVDISTPILRRCFDNTYSVHYCNQGTADANGVYIEVELDKWLSYKSSSIPLKNQQGNLLTFDIGNLPIGECGDFQILTYLNCDSTILGQTHCTNAHIFPDSLCLPTTGWDGSRIRVSGQCLGDTIRFEIKNASNSPMMQQSNYIVVEDEIIMSKKPFQLGANEALKINIPVFGRTYRLEAEQSIGHPGSSKPTVTVENCGTGPVSLGFVNQFYQDDADPFIDIDCQQNRGSYDPNDKQGYPFGYGKNHFIEQNQSIEYLIRFQNTGSDTAFTVRIQDTLSNYLDPTSLIPGASSHPYSYRIFGNGIVEFLFDPIALPDSNVNNAKSIGFVKFTISQKKDLPIGSEIKNNALIYFDYNSPIVTNSTLHTVGKNFITITETFEIELSSMKIYPNPFAQEAIIELDNDNTEKIFELYDLFGRQIRIEQFNGNRLNFKRNLLQSGIYFFKITSKNKPLTQGKLIIH